MTMWQVPRPDYFPGSSIGVLNPLTPQNFTRHPATTEGEYLVQCMPTGTQIVPVL